METGNHTVAIVTGGTSGQGLANAGAQVTIFDHNAEAGTVLAGQLGGAFQDIDAGIRAVWQRRWWQ